MYCNNKWIETCFESHASWWRQLIKDMSTWNDFEKYFNEKYWCTEIHREMKNKLNVTLWHLPRMVFITSIHTKTKCCCSWKISCQKKQYNRIACHKNKNYDKYISIYCFHRVQPRMIDLFSWGSHRETITRPTLIKVHDETYLYKAQLIIKTPSLTTGVLNKK